MSRKVLLLEPNYKNKYPPLNLMKLATYYREICKDEVRFFKGDLKDLAIQLLLEEFFDAEEMDSAQELKMHWQELFTFVKTGKNIYLENVNCKEKLRGLNKRFKAFDYPKFDVICIATLFTFYWKKTIDTINFAKNFQAKEGKIYIGGVAATLVPDIIEKETGIQPHKGLLDKPNDLDETDHEIIDTLPPDYSILEEIDYKYPASDAYISYATRGCNRHCAFCAVTTLEPIYKHFISIREHLTRVEEKFGAKRNLLLLDNNVLHSKDFDKIIDEIIACGFGKGATYIPPDEYKIALKNLRDGYNERAYIRKIISLYDELAKKLSEDDAKIFQTRRAELFLLIKETATKKAILELDKYVKPHFEKYFKRGKHVRYVDFNQGLDARLLDAKKMKRLAEINIHPMRIAFDHVEQREIYEKAIELAAEYGVLNLSNYVLFNFEDKPEDLYMRLKINIDLCERLGVNIYSFPMRYQPLTDEQFFNNRHYTGKHWNKKFIRAVQAILNATKGKVGRGKIFFETSFGKNLDEFKDLLWMPETFIIYRKQYSALAEEWREKFYALNPAEIAEAKKIISENQFRNEDINQATFEKVHELLKLYQIPR